MVGYPQWGDPDLGLHPAKVQKLFSVWVLLHILLYCIYHIVWYIVTAETVVWWVLNFSRLDLEPSLGVFILWGAIVWGFLFYGGLFLHIFYCEDVCDVSYDFVTLIC